MTDAASPGDLYPGGLMITSLDQLIEQAAEVIFNQLGRGDWRSADQWSRKKFRLAARTLNDAGLLADLKLRQDANTVAQQLGYAVRKRDQLQARIGAALTLCGQSFLVHRDLISAALTGGGE